MLEIFKTIAIGCDQGGFELKQFIISKLSKYDVVIKDFGSYSTESIDYPDVAHPLSRAVSKNEFSVGILICGSGNGVCMTANKYSNIRAALSWNTEIAKLARQHNNANIICLPGRFLSEEEGWEIVKMFLSTEFDGGRHERRIEKISNDIIK